MKTPAITWSSPPSPSQIHHLIQSSKDIKKALQIFNSSNHHHDQSTFSLMSSRLALSGHPRAAESLLARAFSELRIPPPESSFLPLLRAYSHANRPLDSLRLFRRMISHFQLQPSNLSYNAVVASLVSNNHLSLAKTLFNEMKAKGVAFTVVSFNILIKALCFSGREGALDAAFRVLQRMPDRGCAPDACSYNTLIDGMCREGRVDDAIKLFDEMPQQGVSHTVVSFTCLMHGLCRAGRFESALKMFDEMHERGVKANVVTYSSLIDGLCKGGLAMKAMELLEQMGRRGCAPNFVTYAAIIDGLCGEGRLRESLEVFDRMRLEGRRPDAGLYGKIIKTLCEANRYQEASNYLDEMVVGGIVPNRLTWGVHVRIHSMVIRGLCGAGDLTRAHQVYRLSRNRGISVEIETYGMLVVIYCKKGDVHRASGIVDDMVIDGCLPEQSIWCSILDLLCAGKKVREEVGLIWNKLVYEDRNPGFS